MHTNFLSALKLIQSYLSERKQRSKINQHIVLGRKFFLGLPTDLYFVQFYLTFFSVIWFLLCKLLIYQILLTTAQLMMQVAILTRSYFTFKNYHFKHLSNKTKKKLRALARVTLYITLEKKKIVMNFFFLMHSLATVPLFGCFTVVKITIKTNIYMNQLKSLKIL